MYFAALMHFPQCSHDDKGGTVCRRVGDECGVVAERRRRPARNISVAKRFLFILLVPPAYFFMLQREPASTPFFLHLERFAYFSE